MVSYGRRLAGGDWFHRGYDSSIAREDDPLTWQTAMATTSLPEHGVTVATGQDLPHPEGADGSIGLFGAVRGRRDHGRAVSETAGD